MSFVSIIYFVNMRFFLLLLTIYVLTTYFLFTKINFNCFPRFKIYTNHAMWLRFQTLWYYIRNSLREIGFNLNKTATIFLINVYFVYLHFTSNAKYRSFNLERNIILYTIQLQVDTKRNTLFTNKEWTWRGYLNISKSSIRVHYMIERYLTKQKQKIRIKTEWYKTRKENRHTIMDTQMIKIKSRDS